METSFLYEAYAYSNGSACLANDMFGNLIDTVYQVLFWLA
jgi:hypothetical protein